MNITEDIIVRLREHITIVPNVHPGCHDCCGPVTTSSERNSNLPSENRRLNIDARIKRFLPAAFGLMVVRYMNDRSH